MQQTIQNKIKQIVASAVDDKSIFGVSVVIKQQDEIVTYHEGNFSDDDRYFIASTTKLFTSTVTYQLCDEGKLSLSDTLSKYFDNDTLKGLHTKDGVDHTAEITIAQLLAHTSEKYSKQRPICKYYLSACISRCSGLYSIHS